MSGALQAAGAAGEPTSFAPLHINRMVTGLWTNTSPMRDAASTQYQERAYGGRQDRISGGNNCEISTRLTLIRRPGQSVYNTQTFPPINRFYSFNTFTLTTESIRVLADTGMGGGVVYDMTSNTATPNTKTPIFTKSAGAGTTYFLGVGNTLYMTNGVDNKQWVYDPVTGTGTLYDWGITAPTDAPTVSQDPRPNPYPGWSADVNYAAHVSYNGTPVFNGLVIVGSDNNLQVTTSDNTNLGTAEPTWLGVGQTTVDGSTAWVNRGPFAHKADFNYSVGELCIGYPDPAGTPPQLFAVVRAGMSGNGSIPVPWPAQIGSQINEGPTLVWQNLGRALQWADVGIAGRNNIAVRNSQYLVDINGNLQAVYQMGRTGSANPNIWETQLGALTGDNTIIWQNAGPYSVPATAPIQYGYAYENTTIGDVSNMSPASLPISVIKGNQVTVSGVGSGQAGVNQIPIYRTAQGGSIFMLRATIPNPGAGVHWTYVDTDITNAALNPLIQAQRAGEGTPLPAGATAMEYHLGRIFAAVGNVVYVSSGPEAITADSSGNAGFNTTFTAQSKIIRFWVTALGIVVLTVRDAYIILGSATDSDPLYMVKWIENLPLLSYDAFAIYLNTAYILTGKKMVMALDSGAGITEMSFAISDLIGQYDPAKSYLTFHSESSADTALFASDGNSVWHRMSAVSAPETGINWSPRAWFPGGISAVQSVEVEPGKYRLLVGPPHGGSGPILMRDANATTDNGTPYPANAFFGTVVMVQPGFLAGLAWMTLEAMAKGSPPILSVLIGEIADTGVKATRYEPVLRTRQDPTNLEPSVSLYSNRHSLLQNQSPVWCRHMKYEIAWPAEAAANELLTTTIFGQTWQEMKGGQ